MKWAEARRPFRAYLLVLFAALLVVLGTHLPELGRWDALLAAGAFTGLLALAEYAALSFHQQGSRYALSAAEAILLPIFVVLPISTALWVATLANAIARPRRWRIAPVQETFNVAQYGLAAFLGSVVFDSLSDQRVGFTLGVALEAIAATITFAAASHIFVAGAISMAGRGRFRETSLAIAPTFLLNLAGNITLGLLLAAAYMAARWTVVLFALPLGAFYLGYRAVLSQNRERERVEHLHSASRALSSSPDLGDTIVAFLGAVSEIASASEARAVIPVQGELTWSGTRGDTTLAVMDPLQGGWTEDLFHQIQSSRDVVIVTKDDAEAGMGLPVQSLLAVPMRTGEEIGGCVMVVDRVGPEAFGSADARLLEALAAELALSLESYRLFAEIAEERERFSRIFSGSKEGIALLDSGGVVRAWNPALERLTGHNATELMGNVWSDVVLIRDRAEDRVEAEELVGVDPDDELEVVSRDGPSRWVTLVAGPVGDSEEGGWVVLFRDVSAEHEIEAAKSDFLSTISHELRTPLTTIKGSLQVLGRGSENLPPHMQDQMISITTRGAERLERLVMNLLAVSQIESGMMPVFPDLVGVDDLVRERVEAGLADHAQTIVSLPDDKVLVRADRERLAQAIDHIFENAMKFGGPQGAIRIEIDQVPGYAHLSVSDEGPGIPEADRERIFERFARLGDVLTRETQGAGVGLFIAKRSVEAMGGNIWVESQPGAGSTFHLEIPLAHPVAVEDTA